MYSFDINQFNNCVVINSTEAKYHDSKKSDVAVSSDHVIKVPSSQK